MPRRSVRPRVLLLGLLLAAACATSPSARLERLAVQTLDDRDLALTDGSRRTPRLEGRIDKVREMLAAGEVVSGLDHLYAATVLVHSDAEEDLALAHEVALHAAERGEERGFRVAAEATDLLLVKRRMMQRYGTQFVFDAANEKWILHPVDPRTTDAERAAMGVPPLAELIEQAGALNEPGAVDVQGLDR